MTETEGTLTEKEAMKLLSENTIHGLEQWSVVYDFTQKRHMYVWEKCGKIIKTPTI